MRLLKHNNVDPKYKELYYKMQVRLYYDIADYNQSKAYRDNYCAQGHIYTDSLLTLLKPQSWEWYYAIGMRSLKKHNYTACIEPLLKNTFVARYRPTYQSNCHLLSWLGI